MKKWLELLCIIVVMGLASTSFALDPLLIGNFETGESSPNRYDLWYSSSDDFTINDVMSPPEAVTLGFHALECVHDIEGGGWALLAYPINERADRYEAVYPLCANEGAGIGFDVTFQGSPGGVSIGYFHNAGIGVGWNAEEFVNVPAEYLDGKPHPWFIPLATWQESFLSILDEESENYHNEEYYNIGIAFDSTTPLTVYVDNIRIYPEGYVETYGPYSDSVDQDFNAIDPNYVDLTLHWKAGADPNEQYEVNPDIVDEYIFMTNGSTTDPNLLYVGATGEDPGLTDPNSEYGLMILPINKSYAWTVVEAIEGFVHTFDVGDSINLVDPNNIIGPLWHFNTLSNLPRIITQPVDARIPLGETADPAFTIEVESATTPIYQWYSSPDAVQDINNDVELDSFGGETASLTLTPNSSFYQRYIYCVVGNAATEAGGGTNPDLYSDVVTLVVERQVAEYKFENNLDDTSDEGNNGTGVNGPAFTTDAIEGSYALSLNGTDQYVELGTDAFPNADLLDADGIGGGMDIGSILCWVKPDQDGSILGNYNHDPNIPSGISLSVEATHPSIVVEGEDTVGNINNEYVNISDGNWHLLAATWDQNDEIRLYMDTDLVTASTTARVFHPWQYSMLLGAGRPDEQDRLTPGDFFGGYIDNLRVYNYLITPEEIAQEYYDQTGIRTCIYHDTFTGNNFNVDDTGSSFCKVDLADFAEFAANWLNEGFYP